MNSCLLFLQVVDFYLFNKVTLSYIFLLESHGFFHLSSFASLAASFEDQLCAGQAIHLAASRGHRHLASRLLAGLGGFVFFFFFLILFGFGVGCEFGFGFGLGGVCTAL